MKPTIRKPSIKPNVAVVLRQASAVIASLAELLDADEAGDDAVSPDTLLTLARASLRYNTSPRALRTRIRAGKLAATRGGRNYLVRADDLDALFAPKLRPLAVVRPARALSEDEEIAAALASAGIVARRTA